jgi:hypothetical protein
MLQDVRIGAAWMPGSRPGMTLKGCAMYFLSIGVRITRSFPLAIAPC